jgi:hypothetical protein
MYWFEVKEQRPEDNQQVLVTWNGEIYVAWYRLSAHVFELRDGTTIGESEPDVKWTEVLRPETDLGR